jgi:hypothetical protein
MKKSLAALLRIIVVFVGIATAGFLLVEPHFEGRNAHATFWQVYTHDPFLWFAYVSSLAFFVGLYQAFVLVGLWARDAWRTPATLRALRIVRYCALCWAVSALLAEAYFILVVRGADDIAGGVVLSLALITLALIMASVVAALERNLQKH